MNNVKPAFHYMPENATAAQWRSEVIRQMSHVGSNVAIGLDVKYAVDMLYESVDRFLLALGAITEDELKEEVVK